MNQYEAMRERQQAEVKTIEADYNDMKANPDDYILSLGIGYVRRTDEEKAYKMYRRHIQEIETAINQDKDGTGFIYDMFYYALWSTEYYLSEQISRVLGYLGITQEEINSNEALKSGLNKAITDYMNEHE